MEHRRRRLAALVLAACVALACAGCTASVDELYSLPQMSEEYLQLQELIAQRIGSGSAYAAPIGGSNRQSVQLRDLDGDGVAEALAFLVDDTDTPTVCIYRQSEDGDYYLSVIISGDGSAVASVDYADLTGDGCAELIIAWQISGDIRLLSVYALSDIGQNEQMQLLSADCSQFMVSDLDGDGIDDLLDMRVDEGRSELVMYSLVGGEVVSSAAELSDGVSELRRTRTGTLSDGTLAVFAESSLGSEGLITDVFAAPEGTLENITMTPIGRSNTLRPEGIFAADLDGDQAMEVPVGNGDADILTWYSLDANGHMTPALSTVYNTADGWYLVLTGQLSHGLVLDQYGSPGESAIMFTLAGDGTAPQGSVLIIYAITGDNRLDRAEQGGRFFLRETDTTVYAAQILSDALSSQDIIDNFYLIYADWQSGEL